MSKSSSLRLYGLIGYPVKHSLSPAMHNAAFKALGINAAYRLFEVKPQELASFLLDPQTKITDTSGKTIYAGDILGFNITIPHKVKAKEILMAQEAEKKLIQKINKAKKKESSVSSNKWYTLVAGAINTVKKGYQPRNTDVSGFLKSLKVDLNFNTKDKSVLVIGCGGAGRAVIAGLSYGQKKVKKIYIYEKDKKAISLAKSHFHQFPAVSRKLKFIACEQMPQAIKKCQLLVNTSPVGMKDDSFSIIKKDLLHKGLSVYDLIYNRQTKLIKDALILGLPAASGQGMLLYQGAAAFSFWVEEPAPIEVMRSALNKELKKI
jgi:shikimate dehydrogenase